MNNKIRFNETGEHAKRSSIAKDREINLTYSESQPMFRRMVERGRFGIFMADVKGQLFYVNHALVAMLGYRGKDDILGTNLGDILFREFSRREEFLAIVNDAGCVEEYELSVPCQEGEEVLLSITSNVIENESGETIGIDGIVHDITEKSRLEDDLRLEKKKMEQILEFDEDISSVRELDKLLQCAVDRSAKILEAQRCSLMLVNKQSKVLTVAKALGMVYSADAPMTVNLAASVVAKVVEEGQPLLVRNIEYDRRFKRANKPDYRSRSFMSVPIKLGTQVWGVLNVSDKIMRQGLRKGSRLNYEEAFNEIDLRILCAIAREVSVAFENVRIYDQLNSLAVTDPLTHIYNYRQFSKSLEYEIKRCRRGKIPLCIIMIDVDDFKLYNDTYGHLEGDELLKGLGQIFSDHLREVDIVCRYAGDEFAIILPNTNRQGALRAVEKIQKGVQGGRFKKDVTLSLGIAEYRGGMTQHELILDADKGLYQAKQEGKNRSCVFHS